MSSVNSVVSMRRVLLLALDWEGPLQAIGWEKTVEKAKHRDTECMHEKESGLNGRTGCLPGE